MGEHCACSTADVLCLRGEHVCTAEGRAECRCEEGWSGEECDCDEQGKSGCHPPRQEGEGGSPELCSGAEQGECQCNECRCKEGFEGAFCQVNTNLDTRDTTCQTMAPCILYRIYGQNMSIAKDLREVRSFSL